MPNGQGGIWPDTTGGGAVVPGESELTLGFEWGGLSLPRSGANLAKVSDQINSRHGGIIIAAYCDGHTASLRGDMDVNVFRHLMTPYGKACCVAALNLPDAPTDLLDESSIP